MAEWHSGEIVVKVMCLIRREDRLLLGKGYDKAKDQYFYRFLGGSLRFGELLEEAMHREIKEELHCALENLRRLEIIENIFTYEEKEGHQIVFLYQADLTEKSLYESPVVHIVEETYEFDAEWVPIKNILEGSILLYPKFDYSKLL